MKFQWKNLTGVWLCAICVSLTAAQADGAREWVQGEVVKIDLPRARVTLKHERIPSIKMAAMTMQFKVEPASLLDAVKLGSKLAFTVRNDDGELVITRLRAKP
jgi:Cu(I)/Ag(I) efflux system periplasmic protein CusF